MGRAMFAQLLDRVERAERRWRRSFGTDISTPRARRWSQWHYNWLDHAHLRRLWTNQEQLAPGVWRSNQPTLGRLRRLRDSQGLKTVLNLRGPDTFAHYLFLREACESLGLTLVDVKLNATKAPSRERLIELLDAFARVERPLLIHCKSGADRTGLAALLWLMVQEGQSLEVARAQLHWRYLHYRNSKAGILDDIVDLYAADAAAQPIPIDTWIRTAYSKDRAKAAYAARRGVRG